MKLKHYMHNGLSIYETKDCKTTFLALPRLSYIIFNHPVVGKATFASEIAANPSLLQNCKYTCKSMSISLVVVSIKHRWREKKLLQEKFDYNDNFWPNDKCWLFWPKNLGFPHSMSVKFGLWTFHKLWKRQNNFDFVDFWLPYSSLLWYRSRYETWQPNITEIAPQNLTGWIRPDADPASKVRGSDFSNVWLSSRITGSLLYERWSALHNTAVKTNRRQKDLISRMLFSELYKIMVNKVTFVGFSMGDRPNCTRGFYPCT